MNNQKVAIVFGLPGVGKTTLIECFLSTRNDFIRLSGGSLINGELSEQERDILRKESKDQVLSNQNILLFNFRKERAKLRDKHIIFDGHCLVKSGDSITVIPVDVIHGLEPDIIIFLDEPTEVIIDRRNRDETRPGREHESASDIDKNRDMQIGVCKDYSSKLNIPLTILTSPTLEDIQHVLHLLVNNRIHI